LTNPLNDLSFKTLFDAVADAMLLVDSTGIILEANTSALQLLDHTETTILGLAVEDLMPDRFRAQHNHYRDAFYKNPSKRSMGNGRNLHTLSRTGKELAVDIGLSPIQTPKQLFTLITLYDAEKRQEAEQALRISEERLRLAKQAAKLGVFDFDPITNKYHWDKRIYEIWGGSPDRPLTYEQRMSAIHPVDRAARQAAFERASDPAGNGEYKIEYRVTNFTDGVERWVAVFGHMHFENGQAKRLVGIIQDITERKCLEEHLQDYRNDSESFLKQQVAVHTASAIAHELNQPLAAISAYSEVALHALSDKKMNKEKLKHTFEGCAAQAQRAGTSLHELMAFLQQGELHTELFDLNILVKDALRTAKGDGYADFLPALQLEQNMPEVLANKLQVQKVLVNLIRNGVEAMRGAGIPNTEITITVSTNNDMNMAHVTVQDSGPGIRLDKVRRIFEPFFTTKPTGIGMGLAISRTLIEANGGQLWLEPNNKPGATFHFTLPFAPRETA
jgi:two-component system, LuxR family, sensor kinase FixL